jgi:hypothetical protein
LGCGLCRCSYYLPICRLEIDMKISSVPSAPTCECFLTCLQLEKIRLFDSAAHAPKFDT